MINPDEESLYQAIKLLIEDPVLKTSLQKHAYETAKASFSLEMWKERWRQIFTMVKNVKL
jgi:hypothetical protein